MLSSSIHSLTSFCLKQCLKPSEYNKLDSAEKCMSVCTRTIVENRLNVRDIWG